MNILRIVGAIVLITLAGGTGYIIGTKKVLLNQETGTSEILVEISYTGGLMDPEDEKNATNAIRIYNNGEVIKETRGGDTLEIAPASQAEIENLTTLMNTEEKNEAFTKNEKHFCDSYVDGIDTEITLNAPGEESVSFSSCDYTFNRQSSLLTAIREITSPDTQTE